MPPPTPTSEQIRAQATEAMVIPDIQGTPRNPKAKALQEVQRRLGADKAMEAMASVEPIDTGKVTKSQDENYTFTKKDGGRDDVAYASEKGREKTAVDEVVVFLDSGVYTDAVRDKILTDVLKISEVKSILEKMQGGAIVPGTTALNSNVENSLKKIAKNPAYKAQLRDSLNGALDSSIASLGEAIGAKERIAEEAHRKWKNANDELDHLNDTSALPHPDSLKAKQKALDDYTKARPTYVVVDTPSNDAEKIIQREFNFISWTNQVRDLTRERDTAAGQKAKLEVEKAQLEATGASRNPAQTARLNTINTVDIPAQEGLISAKDALILPIQAQLDELAALKRDRDALKIEVTSTIPQRINQLTGEVFTLNEDYQNALKAFNDAKKEFENAIQGRVKIFEGMIGQEAGKFLLSEIQRVEARERTRIDEAIAQRAREGDKIGEDLLKSLDTRWESQITKRRGLLRREKTETEIDPVLVKGGVDTLLTGGKEHFLQSLFKDPSGAMRINPGTGSVYSQNDIDEKMKDTEFVNSVGSEAIHRVLGAGIRTGAVNKDNAPVILRASWGAEALVKAREWNKSVDEQLKLFEKEHKLSPGGIINEAKKHKKLGFWLMLMLLSPAAGTLLGGALLAKNMVKSDSGAGEAGH